MLTRKSKRNKLENGKVPGRTRLTAGTIQTVTLPTDNSLQQYGATCTVQQISAECLRLYSYWAGKHKLRYCVLSP
jgi:hypothetical protein